VARAGERREGPADETYKMLSFVLFYRGRRETIASRYLPQRNAEGEQAVDYCALFISADKAGHAWRGPYLHDCPGRMASLRQRL